MWLFSHLLIFLFSSSAVFVVENSSASETRSSLCLFYTWLKKKVFISDLSCKTKTIRVKDGMKRRRFESYFSSGFSWILQFELRSEAPTSAVPFKVSSLQAGFLCLYLFSLNRYQTLPFLLTGRAASIKGEIKTSKKVFFWCYLWCWNSLNNDVSVLAACSLLLVSSVWPQLI